MNTKKATIVAELKDKVSKAKSYVLTDYRGLTHKQLEQLHKDVKKVDGEYVVVKNSLLRIAGVQNPPAGTLAVLFAYNDEFAPMKSLAKFVKEFSMPTFKGAFIGGKNYDGAEAEKLSKLPSKLELQAQVVSMLNSNISRLAYVLSQIKK